MSNFFDDLAKRTENIIQRIKDLKDTNKHHDIVKDLSAPVLKSKSDDNSLKFGPQDGLYWDLYTKNPTSAEFPKLNRMSSSINFPSSMGNDYNNKFSKFYDNKKNKNNTIKPEFNFDSDLDFSFPPSLNDFPPLVPNPISSNQFNLLDLIDEQMKIESDKSNSQGYEGKNLYDNVGLDLSEDFITEAPFLTDTKNNKTAKGNIKMPASLKANNQAAIKMQMSQGLQEEVQGLGKEIVGKNNKTRKSAAKATPPKVKKNKANNRKA